MNSAAVVWVVTKIKEEFKFLILKRANDDFWCPNLWCLPGGKIDSYESVYHGAIRELFEETSLFLKNLNFLHKEIFNVKKNLDIEVSYYVTYVGDLEKNTILLSKEHTDYEWIGLKEIDNFNCVPTLKDRTKNILAMELLSHERHL